MSVVTQLFRRVPEDARLNNVEHAVQLAKQVYDEAHEARQKPKAA